MGVHGVAFPHRAGAHRPPAPKRGCTMPIPARRRAAGGTRYTLAIRAATVGIDPNAAAGENEGRATRWRITAGLHAGNEAQV